MTELERILRKQKQGILEKEPVVLRKLIEEWKKLEVHLSGIYNDYVVEFKRMASRGEKLSPAKLSRLERYQSLLRQVREVLERYNEFLQTNIAQSKKEYAQLGLFNVQDLLTELNVVFDKINTEAIENFVALSASNTPLGEVFQKHFPGIEQSISDIMLNGLVEGLNPRQIARNMTQASNIAQRKAEIIARTELLRAYRIANNEAYKASGVVEKYRRLAAKSNRTCIACIAQDGKIFDISEPLYDHPNGRCTSEPIISGRPELNSRELARDWLRKLPSQRQLLILGKSRYEMLRKGEIDWDSLVDVTENKTWGKSLTPKALKDL